MTAKEVLDSLKFALIVGFLVCAVAAAVAYLACHSEKWGIRFACYAAVCILVAYSFKD